MKNMNPMDNTKNGWENRQTENKTDKAVNAVKKGAERTGERLHEAGQKAGDKIKQGADKASDKINQVVDSAADRFQGKKSY